MFINNHQHNQSGQTLIETMVAVFIMVMGITAALGLANYSLNASSGIRKQIIGMGIAREGVEAVKNMRDTNWLKDGLEDDCYNFTTETQGDPNTTPSYCYPDWLDKDFDIKPPGQGVESVVVDFDAEKDKFWNVDKGKKAGVNRLYFAAAGGSKGLYSHDSQASGFAPSDFYRQIEIDGTVTLAPFDQDTGERILVTSRVWWIDKKCPASDTWPGKGRCSIELQMYLTNWKTF